ncbi:multicopper oxidase family protein [Domibacillus robiginosus]|uniref:multicopper oxidase family protein n=1 Tax=Domibacillus robiginosus TaxID=1071054 RepID=UPI00067DE015|nr:multicopper oxidase family protein [Domibacillus robiginosus]
MKSKFSLFFLVSFFALILSACSMAGMDDSNMDMGGEETETETEQKKEETKGLQATAATETIADNEFTLTAQERTHQLTDNKSVTAWTFNGSVPGPEISVQEGEKVKITLKNELKDPVTIHWHGLPVPNEMDGIPGVTQNAVQPGKSFTYKFTADVPGTYWYHSHQEGATQVDKGLYGSFIVEGKDQKEYDRDYALVLDEWMSDLDSMDMEETMNTESDSSESMEGMDHSTMDMESGSESENADQASEATESNNSESEEMAHDMSMYDIYTINGKSGESINKLTVKEGEKVRLRLVNAGFISHNIHLHGHDFKIISSDGQEIANPQEVKDQLISIAPGERYDIEFTADNPGEWFLESHGEMEGTDGMRTLIQYEGFSGESTDKSNNREELPVLDLTSYGEKEAAEFTLDQSYDLTYTMDLNTRTADGTLEYTINDKTFPDTESLKVKEGDLVKVKLVNNSKEDDHPMHLHGHFFQVLSKNGKPVEGSPLMKDTINLKPGEEYVVAFKADNPGNWMFHCHDLHHASAGMVTQVNYEGFKPKFTPDPNANNQPE